MSGNDRKIDPDELASPEQLEALWETTCALKQLWEARQGGNEHAIQAATARFDLAEARACELFGTAPPEPISNEQLAEKLQDYLRRYHGAGVSKTELA